MGKLIAFHFSLLPFFESKHVSDHFLVYDSTAEPADRREPVTSGLERRQNLDTIFVKTIFPFIERRKCYPCCTSLAQTSLT